MGYMGLDHYDCSDMASDFVYVIQQKITELCKEELKNEANFCNTAGYVNIALFAEVWLKDVELNSDSELYKILNEVRCKLLDELKNMQEITQEQWRDKDMHINAYNRMIQNVTRILNKAY